MEFEGLAGAQKVFEMLEQRLKDGGLKVPTIKESCEQALREHAAAKALKSIGRQQNLQKLERLQAEFDSIEPGTDPASPESLERLVGQIREAYGELESLAAEHIGSPEHTLALDCLKALIAQYGIQESELAARIV